MDFVEQVLAAHLINSKSTTEADSNDKLSIASDKESMVSRGETDSETTPIKRESMSPPLGLKDTQSLSPFVSGLSFSSPIREREDVKEEMTDVNVRREATPTLAKLSLDTPSSQGLTPSICFADDTPSSQRSVLDLNNESQLIFEFCKADWDAKRYSLLKKEAEDRRRDLQVQLVPLLKTPGHLQPNGWRFDLSKLKPTQLEKIGGLGYLELRANSRSQISIMKPSPSSSIAEPITFVSWLRQNSKQPQIVEDCFLEVIMKEFHLNMDQAKALLQKWLLDFSAKPKQTETVRIQVLRYAKHTLPGQTIRNGGSAPVRKQPPDAEAKQDEPTLKKRKLNTLTDTNRLSIEQAEAFMFGSSK
jgi:hypothetical protein